MQTGCFRQFASRYSADCLIPFKRLVDNSIGTNRHIITDMNVAKKFGTRTNIHIIADSRRTVIVTNASARMDAAETANSRFFAYDHCPVMNNAKPWTTNIFEQCQPDSNAQTVIDYFKKSTVKCAKRVAPMHII